MKAVRQVLPWTLRESDHAYPWVIDPAMHVIKVSDHAEEHEELKTALTKWGGARTGFQM